ncbi:MAG: segregation/condensation protein A [Proteobacteria bacterium]|nr:segregation/condensation protein A [Pseudomonadota bacterium]MBU4470682.1 segregation/condensation protein A [Pseudomonadota bacterium]MCG2751223.1 segregation/condensation protein A [Desulfobacteraceae bacterium]
MTSETYQIRLENVFEGPMDLLVHLIRKNEVDIYDIPIALITNQYLGYLDWMKSLNIDIAGDFILMAATLTQIKSKMLLPVHDGEEGEEDPRLEITKPLEEYLKLKSVAERLGERDLLGESTFTRKTNKDDLAGTDDDEYIQVGLFELIDAFQKILKNTSLAHKIDLTSEGISIRDKIAQIVDILEERGDVVFDELFSQPITKNEIIVTFLAMLEMVKLKLINIIQHMESGIIRVFYQ